MTDTSTTLKSSMDGVVEGLRQIASGSLSGAYEGLIKIGNSAEKIGGKLGNAFGKVADALEDVPVIGWIVQIIDLFKGGLRVVVGGLLDAVFNAVGGILSDVLSGDLFVTIGKSVVNGIGGIFNAITFGGFSFWISSSNAKEVQETINQLTDSNETLQAAIENLTDEIKASKGTKSIAAYRDAYKYLQLPCFTKEEDECETDFERWIYVLKNMETFQRLPFKARKSVFEKLEQIVDIASLSKEDRMKYDESIKVYRDHLAVLDFAKQEGLALGMAKGMEQGMAKGMEQGMAKGMAKGMEQGMEQGIAKGVAKGMEQGMAKGMEQGIAKGMEQGMAKGMEQGMAKGMEQGMAKGMEQGKNEGEMSERLKNARRMKAKGYPIDDIADITGLSTEEIKLL